MPKHGLGLVLADAFSPIDRILDFIPVFGVLGDLLRIPVGITLAIRMVLKEGMESARTVAAMVRLVWLGGLAPVIFLVLVRSNLFKN